jgi:hypothetical protein
LNDSEGNVMKRIPTICAAAALVMVGALSPASAAAPNTLELDDGAAAAGPAIGARLIQHKLDVEITVHNWILCASQPFAETLVRAREESPDAAAKAFAELTSARSCGRFAEMQVILQKPIYETLLRSGGQANIYGALINISGAWATGYVVYDGVPGN